MVNSSWNNPKCIFSCSVKYYFKRDQFFEIFWSFWVLKKRENEINCKSTFFIFIWNPTHMPLHLGFWEASLKLPYNPMILVSGRLHSKSGFKLSPLRSHNLWAIRKCLSWYCSIETLLKPRMNLGLNILLIFMVSSSSNPSN